MLCIIRNSMRPLAVYLALALPVLGVARVAVAEPLELEWDAPDACPDRADVEKLVSRHLGERSTTKLSTPLVASGLVTRAPGGFSLTLRMPTGERRLDAQTCDELAESAAVILALVIDPRAAPPELEPESEAEADAVGSEPEVTSEKAPATALPPLAANDPKRALRGLIRVEMVGDAGLLPRVGLGPGLAGGIAYFGATLEFSGTFFPTHDVRSRGSDVGDLSAFAGRFGICDAWLTRPALGPCFFVEYVRFIASGDEGLMKPQHVDGGLWSLLPAARLSVAIGGSFGWVVELGVDLPLSVAEFKVEGRGTAHETNRVVGRARTGFELRF